jgi:hypothetical protein
MKLRYLYYSFFIVLTLVLVWRGYAYYFVDPQDSVILSNASGNEDGILVVGDSSPPLVYKSFTSATDSFSVGIVRHSAANNEVVAFTNQRPPAIQTPVPWTNGGDTVSLAFPAPIHIDVSVWVVTGPFLAQHDLAVNMSIATAAMWNDERMGVDFGAFDIHDATGNARAPTYANFSDCGVMNARMRAMQTAIGKDPNRINVYMVNLVDGRVGYGDSCGFGKGWLVVGAAASDAILAHEIGHNFMLQHVDALAPDFDDTNVMYSASDVRQYFTEGQLFRAHLATLSVLNALYNARPMQTTRDCAHLTSSDTCPPIAKRIWADGSFPAN